ncbi:hypothetical protein ACVWXU_008102 [Streptomyces sp. TE33382]
MSWDTGFPAVTGPTIAQDGQSARPLSSVTSSHHEGTAGRGARESASRAAHTTGSTSSGRSHITAGGLAVRVPTRSAPTLR